jgi:primosomal protein N'
MYVVDVIPFSPGAPGGTLSYRTAAELPPGSIVSVKLRRKEVPAVVVRSLDARTAKASLKAASFALSGTISKPIGTLPPALMDALRLTAEWHAAGMGSVMAQLVGPWITEKSFTEEKLAGLSAIPGTGFMVDAYECALSVRKARYRTLIAENEKVGRATLLAVSTLAEVRYWQKAFSDYDPVLLSGALKEAKRSLALEWARASKGLVIATPHFAFAQVEALGTIVIERVGAGGFRLPKRPYLDIRVALMELARARALTCVLGDYPLPLEYRAGARKLLGRASPVEVINAKIERAQETTEREPWTAVPAELRTRIAAELESGGRVAVFAVRKGYAPVVICRDCGEPLRDDRGKVYAFAEEKGAKIFRTADGRSAQSTDIRCPKCDSWNLLPLGAGVERVAEELKAAFPEAACALFDSDTVRTAVGAARKFAHLKEPGSIVVGTEAMAPWLLAASPAPLSLAAIASADSLLALPFWRARERFLRLGFLLSLRACRRTQR